MTKLLKIFAFSFLTFPFAQASPTHFITLKSGETIAGNTEQGKDANEVLIRLEDDSKTILNLNNIKSISPYSGEDLSKTKTKKGEIAAPSNFRLGFQVGMQSLGKSTYTIKQASGSNFSSNDVANPGFGYTAEIGYKPENFNFGVFITYSDFKYNYASNAKPDSLSSIFLTPKYFFHILKNFSLVGGASIGLTSLSLGESSTTASGTTITLAESNSKFTFSPRMGLEFKLFDQIHINADAVYNSFESDFTGALSTGVSTTEITENISRKWFTFSGGLTYLF